MKTLNFIGGLIIIVFLGFLGFIGWQLYVAGQAADVRGVPIQEADLSTTTLASNLSGFPVLSTQTNGLFGKVIIIKVGTAGSTWSVYDATTTNATLRTNTATTTLVTFPTDTAVGTYTFDVNYRYGLIFEFKTTMGSTTITWK